MAVLGCELGAEEWELSVGVAADSVLDGCAFLDERCDSVIRSDGVVWWQGGRSTTTVGCYFSIWADNESLRQMISRFPPKVLK